MENITEAQATVLRDVVLQDIVIDAVKAVLAIRKGYCIERLRMFAADHKMIEAAEEEAQIRLMEDLPKLFQRYASAKPKPE